MVTPNTIERIASIAQVDDRTVCRVLAGVIVKPITLRAVFAALAQFELETGEKLPCFTPKPSTINA